MINLVPPEQKEAIKFGRLNLVLMQYIILAIIVTVALLGIVIIGAQKLKRVENSIKSQVSTNQESVEELKGYHEEAKQISERVSTLSNLFDREVKFSELLTSLGGVMPVGSSLTQLSVSEDITAPLNLTAEVVDESTAAVLRENLEQSDIFEKADIISITAQEDANSQYKFQVSINVVFEGAAEKQAAEAAAKEKAAKEKKKE